jgi:hypothetical protein
MAGPGLAAGCCAKGNDAREKQKYIAYLNSVRLRRSISHRFNDRKLYSTYGTSFSDERRNKIKTNPTHPSPALANERHERKTFFRTIL